MSAWIDSYFRLINQLYGLAFLVLGVVAFVLPRRDLTLRLAPRLWLLGVFGVSHGLFGIFEFERKHRPLPEPALLWLDGVLLIVSYVAVLEFGRSAYGLLPGAKRLPAWLVHGAAVLTAVCVAMLAADRFLGLTVGLRWFVGTPGVLLSGLSLLATPRDIEERRHSIATWLRAAGAAFIVYGLVIPVASGRDAHLPAWLPTDASFVALTGVPVQVVRALCITVVTVALVALVRHAGAISNADMLRVVNTLDGFVYRCKNDRDWTLIYMTGGVEALCGYRAEEFFGREARTWGSLIHPDDAERVWGQVQAGVDARREFRLSYRIHGRDGSLRWVYELGHGVFDDSGALCFLDGHVMNDTVRMQALADLRIKDAAIESSLNAVAMTTMDGRVRYVNHAFLELWRMPRVEDALGRTPFEFAADEAVVRAGLEELLAKGRWRGVFRARRADGTFADVNILAHVVVDDAGERVGLMASFVDVTAEALLAEELRHERDFATSLVATAPVIILLLDQSGCIQHINAFGASLLGYRPDELQGKDWVSCFVPEAEQVRIKALFASASGGVQTRGNVNAIVTRSGELREIEWNDQLMRDARGNPTGLLAVGLDITDRKRSLEALRASQKQLRDILDGMFAFVGLFSIEGEVLEVNRAPLVAAGIAREEIIGRLIWDTGFFSPLPDAVQQLRAAFRRAASGEMVRLDLQLCLGAGKVVTVDTAMGPVRDEAGQIVRVVGSAVDVTEQRELEQQRLQLEAELRQSQKLEALGTLAGGIAHDFNNVLMAIFGNAELARRDRGDRERVNESLSEIEKAARRAQDLVQRILAFSRRQEHTLKHISLLPVIQEALKLLRSTLPARVTLQFDQSGDDVPVMADASQVLQVIMNLTTNAWHAIGDRPGKVTVSVSSERIDAQSMRTDLAQGQYARIDVRDTGSGISPATLERIFEPFFTTKPAGQGTGLGLSVAHGIMKSHRGAITVDSTPGTGTTFHLYFPAAQPGFVREDAAFRPGPTRGAGEHVLFVDDEQILVELAVRMLGSMGYRVTGHTSGERALVAFRSGQQVFDIVVTDHSMPGMSGIELAQEIAKTSPNTPVVLISGFLREDELQRTLELGIAEVVMKPTTFEHLGALIRAMLDRGRAKRADVA